MESIKFEWDENKNLINQSKHKISFEEAKTVFYDVEALVIDDPDHSSEEERFIILGFSEKANLLVVCHCHRASDTVIRIISARKATKSETKQYKEHSCNGEKQRLRKKRILPTISTKGSKSLHRVKALINKRA